MTKTIVILILLAASGSFSSAQDAHMELMNLLNNYDDPHQFMSADVYIKYYAAGNSTIPIDTMTTHLQMQGDNFHFALRDHEYLHNDKFYLTINNTDKLIFISNNESFASMFDMQRLDSLLKNYIVTIQRLGIRSGKKGYKIIIPNSAIQSIELWFNPTNLLLSKVILFYREIRYDNEPQLPRVEIEYRNSSLVKRTGTSKVFSETRFFTGDIGHLKMATAFNGYRVINNTR